MIFVLALASVAGRVTAAATPVFGSVVAIGGTASDIALDETHGVLYVADFAGSAIDVMSLANNTIINSYTALPYPGSIAVSPDGQYLLAAHYGNGTTSPQGTNAVTAIHIADNSRQVFNMPDPPLAVAFLGTGQAVVVTTTSILTMDPASGNTTSLGTFANLATTLPVAQATFPGQILEAALATSADGNTVWGIGAATTGNQLIYRYYAPTNTLSAFTYVSSPALLARASSSADGSTAMIGYSLLNAGAYIQGRYPNVLSSTNITGVAIDSAHGFIYGQFPDQNQPTGPPGSSGGSAQPSMLIMDSDNLTVRERISIPEDMVGRAALNSAGTVLYAVSESGVMILPVGLLKTYHRVAAGQEDIFVATNFCNGGVLSQSLTITDPGGGQTDFTIGTTQAGVTISPSSGTTPATVQVQVDPTAFPSGGTTAVTLKISSATAVNRPAPVRLLVNKPDPSQYGTIVDQPGVLSDILPDPARNRFYVLRQDRNQLLVFDGTSQSLIATLRTATTPTMMSFTSDQNYLMVGHNDSQLVTVYDLNAVAPSAPIVLPGGHYARSIAQSTAATLVLARNEGDGTGVIDSVNFTARTAPALTSLGIYKNLVSTMGVLTSSPAGANILLASPDGNVMLYTASANTFVASRDDFTTLSGAFAASDFNAYVVGNNTLDASLVPSGTLSLPSGSSSGFTFTGQGGYIASAVSSSSPGVLQQVSDLQGGITSSVTMTEAPLLPVTASGSTSGSTSSYVLTSFTRTIAPLPLSGTVVVLSTSGFTVMAPSYPSLPAPTISALVSAADGGTSVASGELVSIYGQNLSLVIIAGGQAPLSTSLGDACLSANNTPVPLLFVSPGQINAQLPFGLTGSATLNVYTPGGISANYPFTVASAAPSVFRSGTAGPETGLATIVRDNDNQLVTPTNPIHAKDSVTIYLTGMGQTSPPAVEGQAAPSNPPALAAIQPAVTLGGTALSVSYAGLVPGEVGVYQINALVPKGVPLGLAIPLVISQGGAATTLYVRVVK
ncbi:MAG: IPT/TIG domain-containing protein [Bryobacteraceae bacterium]